MEASAETLIRSMSVEQQRLARLSDQAANATTPGYRGSVLGCAQSAEGLVLDSKALDESGPIIETSRKWDLVIEGPGFFVLKAPDGGQLLTRDGRFARSNDGLLVSKQMGFPVLTDSGTIGLPADETLLRVSSTGHILVDTISQGQLRIVAPSDSADMTPLTGALWRLKDRATLVDLANQSRIRAGYYEAAVVDMAQVAISVSMVRNRFDALTTALGKRLSLLSTAIDQANQ